MNSESAYQDPSVKCISDLISLRCAVGFLGSKSESSWWDCDFLSEFGLEACEYNFPRAPLAAAIASTSIAARIHHDERIGKNRSWHLFRGPFHIENQVHYKISSTLSRIALPSDNSEALHTIAAMADSAIDPLDGPVQIGSLEDYATPRGISELAAHYHAAFRAGRLILPYFA